MTFHSRVLPISAAVVCAGLIASAALAEAGKKLPAAIMCNVSGQTFIAYLSKIEPNGSAHYVSTYGGVGVVGQDGIVQPSDTMNPGDCEGRSITDLRESGQTLEFATN